MGLNLDMLIMQYSKEVNLTEAQKRNMGYDPLLRLEKALACKVHITMLRQWEFGEEALKKDAPPEKTNTEKPQDTPVPPPPESEPEDVGSGPVDEAIELPKKAPKRKSGKKKTSGGN